LGKRRRKLGGIGKGRRKVTRKVTRKVRRKVGGQVRTKKRKIYF